jgi:alanine racemase
MTKPKGVRTWIELDKQALVSNFRVLHKLLSKKTNFLAVTKSNAYGHGLMQVAKILTSDQLIVASNCLWFGVDSIVEALRLRREGIENKILVLGRTLPERLKEAVNENITLSVSSLPGLLELVKDHSKNTTWPEFHLKIDTGMHRQGFFPRELPAVIKILKRHKLAPSGIYTHFASAKDSLYPAYTLEQLKNFKMVLKTMRVAGYKNLIRHSAASGGTLLFPDSHLDMVRVGMALYGYYPSFETSLRVGNKIKLSPVLSWRSLVGEVKEIPKDSFVGYDLSEKINRKTKIAVIPVGYWHGFDRGLSSVGEVLIRGLRRKVLGRVSMDMIVVDVTDGIKKVQPGDVVTIIGRDGREVIWADEIGAKIGTSCYEVLTRINPLIYKVVA